MEQTDKHPDHAALEAAGATVLGFAPVADEWIAHVQQGKRRFFLRGAAGAHAQISEQQGEGIAAFETERDAEPGETGAAHLKGKRLTADDVLADVMARISWDSRANQIAAFVRAQAT